MQRQLDIIPVSEWGFFDESIPPLVIAGPCSAESELQVMMTAKGLHDFGIHVFRAGIWKPRTHPGSFEGVGVEGLRWLQKVKREYGMKVCTEVAGEKHVYECMKYGVDMVWIGARTTANPFMVQEIADALRDTDIPVLVKNPVNPDLDLWIGALERLNRAGIRKLGVVHRGFPRPRRYLTGTFLAGRWLWNSGPCSPTCLSLRIQAIWEGPASISRNFPRGRWTWVWTES